VGFRVREGLLLPEIEKRKVGVIEGAIVDHAGQGGSRVDLEVRSANELLERASAKGVSPVVQGGLLSGVTRHVLQVALEVEMAPSTWAVSAAKAGRGSDSTCDGTSPKTVRTEVRDSISGSARPR
jgi:hypothetical protein